MIRIPLKAVTILAALLIGIVSAHAAEPSPNPNIVGTWTGSYLVAFPKSHSRFPDRSIPAEMELEVYKQEDNLVWAINRWRHEGTTEWFEEMATGTYAPDEPNVLYLSESAPAPAEWAATGIMRIKVIGNSLYLTQTSAGSGVSYAAELTRKAEQ